jgi:hypothetical protein
MDPGLSEAEIEKHDKERKRNQVYYSNIALAVVHGGLLAIAIGLSATHDNAHIYGVKTFNTISATVAPQADFYASFGNLTTTTQVTSAFETAAYYNVIVALGPKMSNYDRTGFCYTRPEAQDVGWGSSQDYHRAVDNRRLDRVSKWWLLYIIIGTTAAAHLFRVLANDRVVAMVDNNLPRWDRWVEYAISSPLMILLIAYTTGTIESGTLLALAGSQALLVIIGLAIELSFWQADIEEERRELDRQSRFGARAPRFQQHLQQLPLQSMQQPMQQPLQQQQQRVTIRTPFEKTGYSRLSEARDVSYRPLGALSSPLEEPSDENNYGDLSPYLLRMYGVVFLVVTWVVFVLQWAVIFWSLNDLLSIFRCMNDRDFNNRTSIPIMIAIFEFLLFLSFGVLTTISVSMANYKQHGYSINYAYDILSFGSKAVLAILLMVEASNFKVRNS